MIEADEAVFVGEVAHVVAAVEGGPRGKVPIPINRDSFSNLILLCHSCHRIIDHDVLHEKYPASLLLRWKRDKERDFDATTLAELDQLGPIRQVLPAILIETLKETSTELKETVTRLETAGELTHEAADMLLRAVDTMPSDTIVEDLAGAAYRLLDVADQLPAHVLSQAGEDLSNAAELLSAIDIGDAADSLRSAAHTFSDSSDVLARLQNTVTSLESAARSLPDPQSYEGVAARMEQATQIRPVAPVVEVDERHDGPPLGWIVVGVIAVIFAFGSVAGWWFTNSYYAEQQEERNACTGQKAPRGFKVTRPVEVDGSPSVSPSPYVCPTWYPKPIPKPTRK